MSKVPSAFMMPPDDNDEGDFEAFEEPTENDFKPRPP